MRGLYFLVVAWTACGAALPASAQDSATEVSSAGDAPLAEPTEAPGPSAAVGLDWTTGYFFRGIVQETDGLILQPHVEVAFPLHEGEGALRSVGLSLGVWSSLHTGPTGSPVSQTAPDIWYEADFYVGASVGLMGFLELGLTYTAYASPNGAFAAVHELALNLAGDDSAAWAAWLGGRFAGFAPSVTIAQEVSGTAFGDEEGTLLELAIGPALSLYDSSEVALSVSVPLTLGLGLSDYYEDGAGDEAFGYLSAGLSLSLGLGVIPKRYGTWELSAGGELIVLGRSLEAANAGDGTAFVAKAGLAIGL